MPGVGVGIMDLSIRGLPSSVGARPIIYADFKNGVYQINGSNVTVTDIFYEDSNWGLWDPAAAIVAGKGISLDVSNNDPSVLPALLTFAGSSSLCTMVLIAATPDASTTFPNFDVEIYDDTFTFDGLMFVENNGVTHPGDWSGRVLAPDQATPTAFVITPVTARLGVAWTVSKTKTVASLNGASIITATGSAPGVNPNALGLSFGNGAQPSNTYVESFIVYPPQPNGDLPTLSTP